MRPDTLTDIETCQASQQHETCNASIDPMVIPSSPFETQDVPDFYENASCNVSRGPEEQVEVCNVHSNLLTTTPSRQIERNSAGGLASTQASIMIFPETFSQASVSATPDRHSSRSRAEAAISRCLSAASTTVLQRDELWCPESPSYPQW